MEEDAGRHGDVQALDIVVERDRHGWLQVATGQVVVNGTRLSAGDAVATSRPTQLHVSAMEDADLLLFDLS